MDASLKVEFKIGGSRELTAEFAMNPQAFRDAELLARTLPVSVNDRVPLIAAWLRTIQAEPTLWLRVKPSHAKAPAQMLSYTSTCTLLDALFHTGEENLFLRPECHGSRFDAR